MERPLRCLGCQHENAATARFCEHCGALLPKVCPVCNTPAGIHARFCSECGQALGSEKAPRAGASPIVLEGERKHVTVLFADVVDSTKIVEVAGDPEAAQSILEPFVKELAVSVERHGGTICRIMGDGLVAVFGAPRALEDHALRACRAALDMQYAARATAEAMRQIEAAEIMIRVGLNSGEVVVKTIVGGSRTDYDAAGSVVHLAARMEQTARPGTIQLTSDTLRLVEGVMVTEPIGEVRIKGVDGPIETFRLISVTGHRIDSLDRARRRGFSELVGRERELDQLSQFLSLAKGKQGQVVAVSGEPGLGKSRLFHEFVLSQSSDTTLRVLRNSTVSHGMQFSFQAVVELLRVWFDFRDDDDRMVLQSKAAAAIMELDPSFERICAPIQSLLDLEVDDQRWRTLDPEERRTRTLHALKALVAAECRRAPLILVFEDLHWSDEGTQAFLNSIVEMTPTAPILLLVNYRPEYRDPWSGRSNYTRISLSPLGQKRAGDLLRGLLGDDPSLASLKLLLIARTGGNPLFLEETARGLIDSGALQRTDTAELRLARPLEEIVIPPSVQSIIAARIDTRPPEEKIVLQSAAVIGMEVPFSLLADLVQQAEDDLRRCLANLQAAEFLYETKYLPEPEFSFKHALTHDVAYNGLLRQRRRGLHARIVSAIERLNPNRLTEQTEQLAKHAFEGELWEKAVFYNRAAAKRALAQSAYTDVGVALDRAIVALERLPRTPKTISEGIDIRFELASALYPIGQNARLTERAKEAAALANEINDRDRESYAMARLAIGLWTDNRIVEAMEVSRKALELSAGVDRFIAVFAYATTLRCAGENASAVEQFRKVLRLVDASELTRGGAEGRHYAFSLGFLGWCLAELGDFEEAEILSAESIEASEILNQSYPTAWIRFCAARACQLKGEPGRAIALIQKAIEACATGRIPLVVPWVASVLGNSLVETGQIDEGFRYLKHAISEEVMRPAIKGTLPLLQLAEAYFRVREINEARLTAMQALACSETAHERAHEAWSRLLLWQCACVDGQGDPADLSWKPLAHALKMKALIRRANDFALLRGQIRVVEP